MNRLLSSPPYAQYRSQLYLLGCLYMQEGI